MLVFEMARLYVYAILTALFFGSFVAEGTEKTFSNDEVMEMMRMMQEEIAGLRTKVGALENDKHELMEEIQEIKTEQMKTKSWLNNRQVDADSVFLATISESSIPIGNEEPIIWDSAPINPGGHFSTETGAYTAPIDGYYQFSVTKLGNNYSGSFFSFYSFFLLSWFAGGLLYAL